MRTSSTLLAGLMLWAIPAAAQSQQKLMSKAEFGSFLHTLQSDASRWRETISKVDVSSLSVGYQEGRIIEGQRGFCLEDLDYVRDDIEQLSKKINLDDEIRLLVVLSELNHNLSDLISYLSGLLTAQEARDIPRAQRWAHEPVDLTKDNISPDFVKFQGHLLALAITIDSKIDIEKLTP
jgi:hypothetical protein